MCGICIWTLFRAHLQYIYNGARGGNNFSPPPFFLLRTLTVQSNWQRITYYMYLQNVVVYRNWGFMLQCMGFLLLCSHKFTPCCIFSLISDDSLSYFYFHPSTSIIRNKSIFLIKLIFFYSKKLMVFPLFFLSFFFFNFLFHFWSWL